MTAKGLIFFNDFVDFVLIETSEDNTDNDIDFDQIEAFPDDIETINIEDVIDIPSNDGIAVDVPRKTKILTTNSNRVRLPSERIKKNINVKNREAT